VSLAPPALSIYRPHPQPGSHDTEEVRHHGCAQSPAGAARAAGRRR
jgi:hypothetical protein